MPRARKEPGEATSPADAPEAAPTDAPGSATDRPAEDAREQVVEEAGVPGSGAGSWPADDSFVSGAPSITEAAPGHVRMTQASAASIRASKVEANQSAAARVTGSTVTLSQSASGLVRGTDVHVEQGAVGAVAAEHVEFTGGFAYLVVARRISGQVTVLLDWRGVVAAFAVLLVLGRLLRGRR